jgi:hypothetical protein
MESVPALGGKEGARFLWYGGGVTAGTWVREIESRWIQFTSGLFLKPEHRSWMIDELLQALIE